MDVVSLFPSIPQKECLQIIHEEMCNHQDLLIFDPNLITYLLNINMNHNYFEFADFTFHQTTGTAMGAAFSPTIANIFMSVFFRRVLNTVYEHPLLLTRYIDDIFLIWPKQLDFTKFTQTLKNFHPNITFTITSSENSIDFLDLTIYKGDSFKKTKILDSKTFQKPNNLYQYLHFTSNHLKSTYKGIIIGECIRYARSNTNEQDYVNQVALFTTRLQQRGYPINFIKKCTRKVNYYNREIYIKNQLPHATTFTRPIYKCLPPPQFSFFKKIIMKRYKSISHHMSRPIFIPLRHKTLKNLLVQAKHNPSDTDIIDIYLSCKTTSTHNITTPATSQTSIQLPTQTSIQPKICKHPKCATCQHFKNTSFFKSTTTKKCYKIRHSFSCNSKNIIYLITCTKCKKQYVGKTTRPLKERINHHRTSIFTQQKRYISIHFNFPDHQITNLTVQAIDTSTPDKLDALE